jgi:hypothetical protein
MFKVDCGSDTGISVVRTQSIEARSLDEAWKQIRQMYPNCKISFEGKM